MEKFVTLPGVLLVSGPKGSGKTHLIKFLIYSLAKSRSIDFVRVISPTAYNNAYDFLEPSQVSQEYSEADIYEFVDNQKEFCEKGTPRNAVLVFDDCIGSANFRSRLWEQLATTCRHPRITLVVVTQHIYRLPPSLRDNADTVFILRTIDVDNLQGLYNTCGRWNWRTFKDFERFVLRNTDNFKCIVIDKGRTVNVLRSPACMNKFLVRC
jgi:Poxvirus A32 protein